jgi:hypothetical protein
MFVDQIEFSGLQKEERASNAKKCPFMPMRPECFGKMTKMFQKTQYLALFRNTYSYI